MKRKWQVPHTLVLLRASDLRLEKVIPVDDGHGASSRVSAVYDAAPRPTRARRSIRSARSSKRRRTGSASTFLRKLCGSRTASFSVVTSCAPSAWASSSRQAATALTC